MDTHAGLKRLIAYRQGTLPSEEREELQEHLSLCAQCTGLLRELRDFEAAAAGDGAAGPVSLQDEAWESLARRLPWKVSAVRPIAGAGRPRARPVLRLQFFAMGAAAAMLLACVLVLFGGRAKLKAPDAATIRLVELTKEQEGELATARRSLAEAERQLAAERARSGSEAGRVHALETRVAELTSDLEALRRSPQARDRVAASRPIDLSIGPRFALRGQEASENAFLRGGSAVNAVEIPAKAKSFTVAVSLAESAAFSECRFELTDRDGQVLWAGRKPGKALLGDAGTSVTVHGLDPGLYRLRVEGLEPDRTQLLSEYRLEVKTSPHP